MLALLSLLLPAAAAEPADEWSRSWRWGLGVRGGLVVPGLQSAAGWSSAADIGLVTERALGDRGLSWVSCGDRARHDLERGATYLLDLPESAGAALGGAATHWWLQTGLRWEPALPASPGLSIAPVVGGLVGFDINVTDLELPVPDGRERVRTVGVQPSVAPTFGVSLKLLPELDLLLGASYGLLFAFDQAEVQGADRLAVTGRLSTTLEVLGRF